MTDRDGRTRWYSADPRGVIPLEQFHIPHTLAHLLKKDPPVYEVRVDSAFEVVMRGCMEQRSDALPDRQTDNSASAWAELVVHNGRLSGTRKVLSAPITTIGRAENCDLRLNAVDLHPLVLQLDGGSDPAY